VKAARLFKPLDARLARETYLEALSAALFTGRLPPASGLREAGETALAAPPPPRPARAPDLLLDGLALLATDGYPAGAPVLKQAVSAFRSDEVPGLPSLNGPLRCCTTVSAGMSKRSPRLSRQARTRACYRLPTGP
jgi:hypothetical protein